MCSYEFCKIHRKTPVLEPCTVVFFKNTFLQKTFGRLFLDSMSFSFMNAHVKTFGRLFLDSMSFSFMNAHVKTNVYLSSRSVFPFGTKPIWKTIHKPGLFNCVQITQDLNKIKKNPAHPFVDIGEKETYAKFQQKILNCRVVRVVKFFKFSVKIPGFSKTL